MFTCCRGADGQGDMMEVISLDKSSLLAISVLPSELGVMM